jgi:hypothetical protein
MARSRKAYPRRFNNDFQCQENQHHAKGIDQQTNTKKWQNWGEWRPGGSQHKRVGCNRCNNSEELFADSVSRHIRHPPGNVFLGDEICHLGNKGSEPMCSLTFARLTGLPITVPSMSLIGKAFVLAESLQRKGQATQKPANRAIAATAPIHGPNEDKN